jgi:argininosuccinate lyase
MRLFMKRKLIKIEKRLLKLCKGIADFADKNKWVPMPGYTHYQKAMPSSVGLWAMSYAESLLDDLGFLKAAYEYTDQNPLGSAAGFGVPLAIDRDLTAKLLGFGSIQNNVLYVQNSRGKIESVVLSALSQIMLDIARFSNDIILYSTTEFGFFDIGEKFRTGSSIMPKKRNPDILELIRGKMSLVVSYNNMMYDVLKNLPSGYHRDTQETKEPIMKAIQITIDSLEMMAMVLEGLEVHKDRLSNSFTSQIFATDEAFKLVEQGMSFRDAYKHVDYNFQDYKNEMPEKIIRKRKYKGTTGNLGITNFKKKLNREIRNNLEKERKLKTAIYNLIKI